MVVRVRIIYTGHLQLHLYKFSHSPFFPDLPIPPQISAELGLNEMRERTWQILPCSARTGDGLQEGESHCFFSGAVCMFCVLSCVCVRVRSFRACIVLMLKSDMI